MTSPAPVEPPLRFHPILYSKSAKLFLGESCTTSQQFYQGFHIGVFPDFAFRLVVFAVRTAFVPLLRTEAAFCACVVDCVCNYFLAVLTISRNILRCVTLSRCPDSAVVTHVWHSYKAVLVASSKRSRSRSENLLLHSSPFFAMNFFHAAPSL